MSPEDPCMSWSVVLLLQCDSQISSKLSVHKLLLSRKGGLCRMVFQQMLLMFAYKSVGPTMIHLVTDSKTDSDRVITNINT